MLKVQIFGVNIDARTREDALKRVEEFVQSGQHYVVTPNPEIILAAQKDHKFRDILNKADLAMPDGFGLLCAAWFLRLPRLHRMTGVDLMLEICKIAAEQGKSVFLLGAQQGIGEKAAEVLQEKFPKLNVVGVEWGGRIQSLEVEPLTVCHSKPPQAEKNLLRMRVAHAGEILRYAQDDILKKAKNTKPDILFVALGHPKQEKWIAAHLKELPSVKLAMGVGGAFDYIAGVIPRAPVWMRTLGLEWLYRLIRQPWRIRRILNAVIVFPWKVVIKKIWFASA